MPRHYEIDSAWRASIKREPNGRQTVTTENFVSQLALINFNWSYRQANQWIETYVTVFKDISTQEGENRTFIGRSWKHLHLELDWTRSRTKRAVTRRTEKLAKCVTHSHLAFLKRMNRRRQNTAITPSTTK